MKHAVSIPDELSLEADRAAKNLGLTRSALYGRALSEFLRSIAQERTTRALDEVAAQVGSPRDEFVSHAARKRLEQTEW